MNVALIGMPASGKTRVGRELAKLKKMLFIDTDEEIKKIYGDIKGIFEEKGEEFFREIESDVVKKISEVDNAVISTGGGVILKEDNMSALKKNSVVVYLFVSPKTVFGRTKRITRPVVGDLQSAKKLYEKRSALYEKYADLKVDSNDYDLKRKTEEIILFLENYGEKK